MFGVHALSRNESDFLAIPVIFAVRFPTGCGLQLHTLVDIPFLKVIALATVGGLIAIDKRGG